MSKKKSASKSSKSLTNAPWLPDLLEFISMPSVSTDSAFRDDVIGTAKWLKGKFTDLGYKVSMLGAKTHPAVFATPKLDPDKKTILIYGHYDVQPAKEEDGWLGDPFVPRIKAGKLIARGSTDNKGQIYAYLEGIRQLINEGAELPVNVAFLIEGEEEIGSPNLAECLAQVREKITPCAVILSDTGIPSRDQPALTYSCRGLINFEINIRAGKAALHSGIFGGAVVNPALEMAKLVSKMKDEDGRITIPGIYDDVKPAEKWERAAWKDLPITEESIMKSAGVYDLMGEKGYTALERLWLRPALDINGIKSGYIGEGAKTEISDTAMCKLSIRLVPDQDPKKIEKAIAKWVKENTPSYYKLKLDFVAGCGAFYTDPNSDMIERASKALEKVFGKPPIKIREGGSIPVLPDFQDIFKCDLVLAGFAMPDCGAHSKEEYMPLVLVEKLIAYFRELVLNQMD